MKQNKHTAAALAAVALAGVVVTGSLSAAAVGGSESDPLVTLSYLTQVYTPQMLAEVDKQVTANEQALTDKLNAAIDAYVQKMEAALGNATGSGTETGDSGAYTVLSFQAGQVLQPEVGCELLLRFGAGTLSADSSPGLLDTTAGTILENGGALTANHLYLTTVADRSITFSAAGKLLVRGSYTLR